MMSEESNKSTKIIKVSPLHPVNNEVRELEEFLVSLDGIKNVKKEEINNSLRLNIEIKKDSFNDIALKTYKFGKQKMSSGNDSHRWSTKRLISELGGPSLIYKEEAVKRIKEFLEGLTEEECLGYCSKIGRTVIDGDDPYDYTIYAEHIGGPLIHTPPVVEGYEHGTLLHHKAEELEKEISKLASEKLEDEIAKNIQIKIEYHDKSYWGLHIIPNEKLIKE